MTERIKVPGILSIADYQRDPDIYKKHDYNPFSDTVPVFMKGKYSEEEEPEWWRAANEIHASKGRTGYHKYYFKALIKSRKHGNYMRGFMSLGRSHREAHDGLMTALDWKKDPNKILIDINFDQYKKLRK